ncbi:MAG: sulfatase [Acidobacteriota bacterium]|nr:sulfatase [Acidobacteriota bacterium]
MDRLPHLHQRFSTTFNPSRLLVLLLLAVSFAGEPFALQAQEPPPRFPNVLVITVDTLRTDRVSAYGYHRKTSPALDRLIQQGARFDEARCVEPLTGPSLASMLTSVHPHDHGATRNGLAVRPGLTSLGTVLGQRGYRTAALVSNWTLRSRLSGLDEHFEEYVEVFTRKRWFGLMNSEATAEDVTTEASQWIRDHAENQGRRPFLAWVHYVEPHAPYRLHEEQAERLRLGGGELSKSDRYDTEVGFVDQAIGELLATVEELYPKNRTVVVFASDHGENLGEHGYWGHGRHLWEENLRIPLSITWPGTIPPQVVRAPSTNLDIAPTVLGLIGLPIPEGFQGLDWTPILHGDQEQPLQRTTHHQAHRGAVHSPKDEDRARRKGLLEVAIVEGQRKEVLRIKGNDKHRAYDLSTDPGEQKNLVTQSSEASATLATWLGQVNEGLTAADNLPAPALDEESREQLRALGYLD